MKKYIPLKDGGQIAYQQYGAGSHNLILYHGLAGSSWLGDEWITPIKEADVTVYAIERPGYGDSAPLKLKKIADWIPYFKEILAYLNLSSVSVIGCSAGAPFSYASGAAAPSLVKEIHILGGVPCVYLDSILMSYSEENRQLYKQYAKSPLTELQTMYTEHMEAYRKSLKDTDASYIHLTVQDVMANNCLGMARESQLQILPWGFEVSELSQPVKLWHGKADEMVPYDAAAKMPTLLKAATLYTDEANDAPGESTHINSITRGFINILKSFSL